MQTEEIRKNLPTFETYHTAVKRFATDRKMKLHEAVAHIVVEFMESTDNQQYLEDYPIK